ncbi:hypothetical protein EF847_03445 [Actinobacteria bacterium YIM 96077]|uniref:Uncharacterized protein n=1 Tax=Phytoactinopolyspora halophila TaxID=1981511 RepID=A0A329R5Z7_9ACTN|nr:hypothetical protein EF847_03445 [Actinobacteria bacterium YIM 96077]RAW18862.1 hypothetical protein DPM12_02065 [Phytoactinopolyspora halophila]
MARQLLKGNARPVQELRMCGRPRSSWHGVDGDGTAKSGQITLRSIMCPGECCRGRREHRAPGRRESSRH